MKLRDYILEQLAAMVVGDSAGFPYRSSFYITRFFNRCGFPFVHDGSTRRIWAAERLKELNLGPSQSPDLPSDSISRVIAELFEPDDFDRDGKETGPALMELNKLISKQSLEAYLDASGRCYLRNTGSGLSSATSLQQPRPLTAEEIAQRSKVAAFLASASEDDLTNCLLAPLFQRLGFHRITATGHEEKLLEYGKDLWMKYQLPTGHWIYLVLRSNERNLMQKEKAAIRIQLPF